MILFDSEMRSEIENTKAIALVLWSILGHSKGAYFRLLRADLDRKVSPLDSPFRVLLDSVILFDSETRSEIENTKAIAFVFWSILGHSKGVYFRLLRADLDGKVSPLDSFFQTLLDSVISSDSETHSKIENTKAIALVIWLIFGHSKGGLFSAPTSRSGLESIAT